MTIPGLGSAGLSPSTPIPILMIMMMIMIMIPGLGPAGLPPFTPTPYETSDQFPVEPNYVTSAFVREQKRGQRDFDSSR